MKHTYKVEAGNYVVAGEASSSIKGLLKRLGIEGSIVRRMAIGAYEAEMNIVIHSVGGEMTIKIAKDRLVLISEDLGPGIYDIEKAMVEGYSTAPDEARKMGFGAGMGLANIKRSADRLKVDSEVDRGTRLEFVIYLK